MAETRLFTLEDAERTLPLVRKVVEDLVTEYPEWRAAVAKYELLALDARPETGESEAMLAAFAEVNDLARRIDSYLRELEHIGCVFKGFDGGLVDFPSLREDEPIYLCWKLGEERITYWHGMDTGFAGRQLVDDAVLSEVG